MMNTNNKQDTSMAHAVENQEIFTFSNGVPGFPDFKDFYLTDLKDGFYDPLKLLVSVDNPMVSFILYPHINGGSLFDHETLSDVAKTYDRERADMSVYSVVTVREPNGHLHLTTNLKAPIVLDPQGQTGWQHILTAKEADMAFPLNQLSHDLQKLRAEGTG